MNIRKIANLAKLEIKDEELPGYERDIEKVLALAEKLKEVDVKDVEPMKAPLETENVFREDVPRPSLSKDEALKNAPAANENYFIVPKIVE